MNRQAKRLRQSCPHSVQAHSVPAGTPRSRAMRRCPDQRRQPERAGERARTTC
jgi:hypothetical protein